MEVEVKKLNFNVKIIKFADDTNGGKVITSAETEINSSGPLTAYVNEQINGA